MTVPALIARYIDAYNAFDVPGMLECLDDAVRFENYAGDVLNAQADDKAAFKTMAEAGAGAFSTRRQVVRSAMTVADYTMLAIDYTATVAKDLPNGWTAGQELSFSGRSLIKIADGKIVLIIDQA